MGNEMTTYPRSRFPPGYSGHEHMAAKKFGYSIPAPDKMAAEPIDGDDPTVNWDAGKGIFYEPLPPKCVTLKAAPEVPPTEIPFIRGPEPQMATLVAENEHCTGFLPQTSQYLSSKGGQVGVTLTKGDSFTPAVYGVGTGYNKHSTPIQTTWMGNAPRTHETTMKASHKPPNDARGGLKVANFMHTRGDI